MFPRHLVRQTVERIPKIYFQQTALFSLTGTVTGACLGGLPGYSKKGSRTEVLPEMVLGTIEGATKGFVTGTAIGLLSPILVPAIIYCYPAIKEEFKKQMDEKRNQA